MLIPETASEPPGAQTAAENFSTFVQAPYGVIRAQEGKSKPSIRRYAAKFSTPYSIAVGMLRGDAGLGDYEESVVQDPAVRALAAKVRYVIDPSNPYPRQFTGHLRVTLRSGEVREARQSHFRGGVDAPLSFDDLVKKFRANCIYGGLDDAQASGLLKLLQSVLQSKAVDLQPLRCA